MLDLNPTSIQIKVESLEEENEKLKNVVGYLKAQLDEDLQAKKIQRLQDECDKKQLAILAVPAHFNGIILKLRKELADLKIKLEEQAKINSSHEPPKKQKPKPKVAVKPQDVEKKKITNSVMCAVDNQWYFFPEEIDSYWVEYTQRLFDCRNKKELKAAKEQIIQEIGEDLEVLWTQYLTSEMRSKLTETAKKDNHF